MHNRGKSVGVKGRFYGRRWPGVGGRMWDICDITTYLAARGRRKQRRRERERESERLLPPPCLGATVLDSTSLFQDGRRVTLHGRTNICCQRRLSLSLFLSLSLSLSISLSLSLSPSPMFSHTHPLPLTLGPTFNLHLMKDLLSARMSIFHNILSRLPTFKLFFIPQSKCTKNRIWSIKA
jgi:hypothetical protein